MHCPKKNKNNEIAYTYIFHLLSNLIRYFSEILYFLLDYSNQNELVVAEDMETKYTEHPPQPPPQELEKTSSTEVEVSSSINPDYNESKTEVAPGSHQHPVVHTSANYGFGFMPPVLSSPLTTVESLESQARDAPRLPGFVVCLI